jgi:hypothetical protein
MFIVGCVGLGLNILSAIILQGKLAFLDAQSRY